MRAGQRIGKYILGEQIARGGMAEVWAARVEGPEGFVKSLALKFILESFKGDADLERLFVNEARVAAQLQHANLVSVFDFDKVHDGSPDDPGRYFIAMERVDGHDLRRILQVARHKGVRMSAPIALHVTGEILKALRYVHERREPGGQRLLGLVHRDVSPHNVLVGMGGEVKLSDFGIAKVMTQSFGTGAGTGAIRGKLAYASPEQLRGEAVDHRTDQFGTGVTLWEMLSGARLFDGPDEASIIGKVMRCEIAPLAPEARVSPAVESVARRMLSSQAAGRFASTADALAAVVAAPGYTADGAALGNLMHELFDPRPMALPRTIPMRIADPSPLGGLAETSPLDRNAAAVAPAGAATIAPGDGGVGAAAGGAGLAGSRDADDERANADDAGGEAAAIDEVAAGVDAAGHAPDPRIGLGSNLAATAAGGELATRAVDPLIGRGSNPTPTAADPSSSARSITRPAGSMRGDARRAELLASAGKMGAGVRFGEGARADEPRTSRRARSSGSTKARTPTAPTVPSGRGKASSGDDDAAASGRAVIAAPGSSSSSGYVSSSSLDVRSPAARAGFARRPVQIALVAGATLLSVAVVGVISMTRGRKSVDAPASGSASRPPAPPPSASMAPELKTPSPVASDRSVSPSVPIDRPVPTSPSIDPAAPSSVPSDQPVPPSIPSDDSTAAINGVARGDRRDPKTNDEPASAPAAEPSTAARPIRQARVVPRDAASDPSGSRRRPTKVPTRPTAPNRSRPSGLPNGSPILE